MQVNTNLYAMGAEVSAVKPNAKKTSIYKDINARIRRICDEWQWSALLSKTVINIPNAYVTGTVTLTTSSTTITGSGTAWPVADVVNTTMTQPNLTTGYVEIQPGEMTNIGVDTLLYIDDGVYSEVVPVVDVSDTTFTGLFRYQHNAGSTLTTSSLAGRQLQLGAYQAIYTLLGVSSTTAGIIDTPFAGATLTGSAYSLLKAYVTVDPNLRDILLVWDPVQGVPLKAHLSQAFLATADPQRQASGYPQALVDWTPSVSGTMQYELWPYQESAYAIPVMYCKQWPELKKPSDKPPYFINYSVIVDGAIADALRRKDIRSNDEKDPYWDPNLANIYEAKFRDGLDKAMKADDGKAIQALTVAWNQIGFRPSAQWAQSHAVGIEGYGANYGWGW